MKYLSVDIETKPHLVYKWDLFDRQIVPIDMIAEPGGMICFAANFFGVNWTGEPVFYSVFHDGYETMLRQLWDLLNEADATVTYNGDHFDDQKIKREFISFGYRPPAPYKRVDLYKTVKKRFGFPSGKLNYVCQELGIGAKYAHEGFGLWRRCMAGDIDAWAEMREYNIKDVVLTEQLYRFMVPWNTDLPSWGAETGQDCCPACGSDDLRREGHAYTRTGRYQRYVCRACDTWSRASRRDQGTGITQVAA